MADMGRPRDITNSIYPEGFYPPGKKDCCRMRHPITGKLKSLKTRNIEEGLQKYWQLTEYFEPQKREIEINKLRYSGPLLSHLSKEYRENILANEVSKRGASKGERLDDQTLKAYTNYLINLEAETLFQKPISIFADPEEGPRRLREYLSTWLQNPKTYNYRLTCYSRLFEYCIDKGLIQRNPCKDISNRTTANRNVYIPDDHYIAICQALKHHFHEVYARACDWMYLMSGRVGNMLEIEEKLITKTHVKYYATKNKRLGEMKIDADIQFLINWFRHYKKEQGVISKYLIVHPLWMDPVNRKGKVRKQIAGQPILVDHLYRRFQKAKAHAGLQQHDYTPRDLRPRSLTDEAIKTGGPTNKGMHSETMQRDYVKGVVAEQLTNNLTLIKWDEE